MGGLISSVLSSLAELLLFSGSRIDQCALYRLARNAFCVDGDCRVDLRWVGSQSESRTTRFVAKEGPMIDRDWIHPMRWIRTRPFARTFVQRYKALGGYPTQSAM